MSDIIISFTSYPKRILTIDKVLESVINQTVLPDKIILYLSSQEFENFGAMPNLKKYDKYGFEIHWCDENLKSHNKYYYAMQEYPDDIVITIDDDIYYKDTMIEELLKYHIKYPEAVVTRRAHLVTWMADWIIAPYEKWYMVTLRYAGTPRMDLVATGVSGVLYPPHIFSPEIFNKALFMEKAPYADDLWLKVMELHDGIPVVLTSPFFDDSDLEDYSTNGLYCSRNANGGNDIQLHALLEAYGNNSGSQSYLVKKLASDGRLMLEDYEQERKNDIMQFLDAYFKMLDGQEGILVYGAGDYARRIYRIFEETGQLKAVKAFVVNCVEENEKELGGIQVRDYRDFVNSSEKIIIGLSCEKQDEVHRDLVAVGVSKERIMKLDARTGRLVAML